jgi:hypothetical protein
MRIGFTSIYAWRPHVEHLHFLAGLARDAGHSTYFLACDADLAACYNTLQRPDRRRAMHCARCMVGGIRSYEAEDISSIGALAGTVDVPADAAEWALSSVSTLGRFESEADFSSEDFARLARRLDGPTRQAFKAARRWIDQQRLEAVVLFNGRMDATRAVLEAARDAGIPFVSVERTWFGDGLQMLPNESCLGLSGIDRMMREWRDRPLRRHQALRAARHIAARFMRRNTGEWRAYNVTARETPWPVAGGRRRILLVPGSRNEVWGHPDWASRWPDHTHAFDAVIQRLGLSPNDLVLRCHPNWGETIGGVGGDKSERHFAGWATARGIHCIGSRDPISTSGLIQQCDAVLVCGGSAALEAGALGKQVIAVSPSIYQQAGFQSDADSPQALGRLTLHADLGPEERSDVAATVSRLTLRFAYTMSYRVSQFVDQVRLVTTTRYDYRQGADPDRLTRMLVRGCLEADDPDCADDTVAEDEVLRMIRDRQWATLLDSAVPTPVSPTRQVRRRWMFRPIDRLREALPRGDLG